jgi:uncharacterized repeat protein (TIGR03803 family)
VIRDAKGNLYGTASSGARHCGVVFKLSRTGKETILHRFTGGADGANPTAGVIQDAQGNLYGTTIAGGGTGCGATSGHGVVYRVDPTGKETVLYAFTGGADGASPFAGVIQDAQGNLYGTTTAGGGAGCGTSGCGVVYRIDPSGKETVLYAFTGGADGLSPYAGVIQDAQGNLYGTTVMGGGAGCGNSGCGVVYKLDTTGKETVLYTFTNGPDGAYPYGGLIQDTKGNLFGTARRDDGSHGGGVVLKLSNTGKETVLYDFTGGADGGLPDWGVIQDGKGNLYGTTIGGGEGGGLGTVFKLDKAGKETVLYSFRGGTDGAGPSGGVIRDAKGNLYGTTSGGGQPRNGTVFKITP